MIRGKDPLLYFTAFFEYHSRSERFRALVCMISDYCEETLKKT